MINLQISNSKDLTLFPKIRIGKQSSSMWSWKGQYQNWTDFWIINFNCRFEDDLSAFIIRSIWSLGNFTIPSPFLFSWFYKVHSFLRQIVWITSKSTFCILYL
jgi:hypothetical protein